MYAVIQTGGKQYRVTEGDTLRVEKLVGEGLDQGTEANEKSLGKVEFKQVLLVADDNGVQLGRPYVEGAKVSADIQAQGRSKKINIIKFRRRKHHMKRMGHRQAYTELKVTGIHLNPAPVEH